jgi:hypothetical protein
LASTVVEEVDQSKEMWEWNREIDIEEKIDIV